MKKIILIWFITFSLTACQKEPQTFDADSKLSHQFDQFDNKLDGFLNQLDDPKISREQSKKIICEDYPKTYVDFIPIVIKLSPEYTEPKLFQDMNVTLAFYKEKLGIECNTY